MDDNINSLIKEVMKLTDLMYKNLKIETENIINNNIIEKEKIENILEQLLDIGDREDVFLLYKDLCKYYYNISKKSTLEYIHLYQEIWGDEDNKKLTKELS